MSLLRDRYKLKCQVAQGALDFVEKIHQELLCRDKGIRTPRIAEGAMPMVGLNRRFDMPATHMGHNMCVIEADEALSLRCM